MAANKKGKITKHKVRGKLKHKIYGKCQVEIGSSSKGHAFAEYRKQKVLNQYKKLKRHQRKPEEGEKVDEHGIGESNRKGQRARVTKKKTKYETAEAEYEIRKSEKERLKKEAEELRTKRAEEFQSKHEKRRETHQKLKKRTRRGQPIMANHIECLLEKIQRG